MSSVRLSARLSVTLVDQDNKGWKFWKIIAQTISLTPSLFVAQRPSNYSQGKWGNFVETRGDVGKSGVLEHKSGNTSETREDRGKVSMVGLYELTNALSTVPSPTPYCLLFPKIGASQPHPKPQSLLTQEMAKLWTSNLAGTFIQGPFEQKPINNFGEKEAWAYSGTVQSF